MNAQLDTVGISRRAAAKITGLTESQIAHYIGKPEYGLFPEMRTGTGRELVFKLRHILELAALAEFLKLGVSAKEAVRSFKGLVIWPPEQRSMKFTPGASGFAQAFVSSPNALAWIELDLFRLFESVYPAFLDEVRGNRGVLTKAEVEAMIAEYESWVEPTVGRIADAD
jgi:hypothetical protein